MSVLPGGKAACKATATWRCPKSTCPILDLLQHGLHALEPMLGHLPRRPGTHMVGLWVTDSIKLYRVLRTGIQYIGNWASRVGTSMFYGNPHVDS